MTEVEVRVSREDAFSLRRAGTILRRLNYALGAGTLTEAGSSLALLADDLQLLVDRIDREIARLDPHHWRLPDYAALSKRLAEPPDTA